MSGPVTELATFKINAPVPFGAVTLATEPIGLPLVALEVALIAMPPVPIGQPCNPMPLGLSDRP